VGVVVVAAAAVVAPLQPVEADVDVAVLTRWPLPLADAEVRPPLRQVDAEEPRLVQPARVPLLLLAVVLPVRAPPARRRLLAVDAVREAAGAVQRPD
jgi:hypothetical protein